MAASPHQRTLQRALEVLGGIKQRLAVALEIAPHDLEAYLTGKKPVPQPVFLDALDIVAGRPLDRGKR